jgi:ammonia channel protein AmtB
MEDTRKPFWWPEPQGFIAVTLVLAMVSLVFVLVYRGSVPESDMLKMVVGGLMTTGFATIIGFYFGSSKGSKDKDDALITKATVPVPPTPTDGEPK